MPDFIHKNLKGLHLILGPMFSGKTTKLIDVLNRFEGNAVSFKPAIDDRYTKNMICTHDGSKMEAIVVNSGEEIVQLKIEERFVLIDEAQFFDASLVNAIDSLKNQDKCVFVSGLDMDYLQRPFETIEQLKRLADSVTMLQASCVICGKEAIHTFKKAEQEVVGQVLVGGADIYEARCTNCYHTQ